MKIFGNSLNHSTRYQGQQARIALARTILSSPKILL